MVPELRKRHRIIWQIGSVLLCLGFVAAVWVLPRPAPVGHWPKNELLPFPKALASKTTGNLSFQLRQGENNLKQIEITQHRVMEQAVIQVLCNNVLQGTLGPQGVQRFNLDDTLSANPPYLIELVDAINHKTIHQITLP